MDLLLQHLQALIFSAPQPITSSELRTVLEEVLQAPVEEAYLTEALEHLRRHFAQDAYAFELVEIAGGYQFLTKGAYHASVALHLKLTTKKRLSQAALETLALVAYKQPVSKSELEAIRGVNCDYALQKLLEKELVAIAGRGDGPGRPLLYATTEKFMDYLGIRNLTDLPKPKDFKEVENSVGETPAAEENIPST